MSVSHYDSYCCSSGLRRQCRKANLKRFYYNNVNVFYFCLLNSNQPSIHIYLFYSLSHSISKLIPIKTLLKICPNKNLHFSLLTHAHQIPLKTCPKNRIFQVKLTSKRIHHPIQSHQQPVIWNGPTRRQLKAPVRKNLFPKASWPQRYFSALPFQQYRSL